MDFHGILFEVQLIIAILYSLCSFPPPWITGKNSNQWLLDAYQADFSHWLPSSTSSTIKK